jgi:hypothetical protein
MFDGKPSEDDIKREFFDALFAEMKALAVKKTDSNNFGVHEGMHNWHLCFILVRVAIPGGKEQLFEDWTGLKLQEPPKVSLA